MRRGGVSCQTHLGLNPTLWGYSEMRGQPPPLSACCPHLSDGGDKAHLGPATKATWDTVFAVAQGRCPIKGSIYIIVTTLPEGRSGSLVQFLHLLVLARVQRTPSKPVFLRHVLSPECATPRSWGPMHSLGWPQLMRKPQTSGRGRHRHNTDHYSTVAQCNIREQYQGRGSPQEATGPG